MKLRSRYTHIGHGQLRGVGFSQEILDKLLSTFPDWSYNCDYYARREAKDYDEYIKLYEECELEWFRDLRRKLEEVGFEVKVYDEDKGIMLVKWDNILYQIEPSPRDVDVPMYHPIVHVIIEEESEYSERRIPEWFHNNIEPKVEELLNKIGKYDEVKELEREFFILDFDDGIIEVEWEVPDKITDVMITSCERTCLLSTTSYGDVEKCINLCKKVNEILKEELTLIHNKRI